MNPESAATPPAQNRDSALSRFNPLNPERPAATPNPESALPRIDPKNPESAAAPTPRPRLTPTKARALRTTTLSNTWQPGLHTLLASSLGHSHPAPGCQLPQPIAATAAIARATGRFTLAG